MVASLAEVVRFVVGLLCNCTEDPDSFLDRLRPKGVDLDSMTREEAIPALKSEAWRCEAVSLLTKSIVVITAGVLIFSLGISLASPFAGVVVNVIAVALGGIGSGLVGFGISDGPGGLLDAVSRQYSAAAQRARDLQKIMLIDNKPA